MKKLLVVFMLFTEFSYAKTISIGIGFSIPPYIIEKGDQGIELNIIKEAFAIIGHDVVFRYYDVETLREYFTHKVIDAAIHMHEDHPIKPGGFSQPHIAYNNVVIALKKSELSIKHISQLEKLKVMSFNSASDFLGSEFAEMAKNNPYYVEKKRDSTRVFALQHGLVDAIVMDINIYNHWIKKDKRFTRAQPVKVFDILDKTHYRVGFHDLTLLKKFDSAIESLKSTGRYNVLLKGGELDLK
jgi:polar amino acid transport system substrate-binding protein